MGEIVPLAEVAALAGRLRERGRVIVLTNGCFDLLHVGHLRCLAGAKRLGDVLLVGVNDDESVRRLKGAGRPFQPAAERAELVAGLAPVDYAFVFHGLTAASLVREIAPHVYAKGGGYTPESLPEAEAAAACGTRLALLPLVPGRSTTALAARITGHGGSGLGPCKRR
ncbi:MAG: adenylyltransferase/cytidyltransferase family protein [Patescibacteria group bacterium]